MAQQATRQTTAVAVSRVPPANYKGSAQSWRVLTETIWPTARSSESIMLALSYCAARNLNPFKKPIHIVPVYNSALKREVDTVWPGINELLTTASRSKQFAGVDEPLWGEDETQTFSGTDREGNAVTKTLTYPTSCTVAVWRIVNNQRVKFSQPVYWVEAYGRRAFKSELPNDMWEKRPRGQLHKCSLAASLRLGFPEDIGGDYAAEEMEGKEVATGGVVIDHEDEPSPDPPGEPVTGLDLLQENNGTVWLRNLQTLLGGASTEAEIVRIAGHPRVQASLGTAPTLVVEEINGMIRQAHERVRPHPAEAGPSVGGVGGMPEEPIFGLLAAVEAMSLADLDDLRVSSTWQQRTNDLFPPDFDRLEEAIAARRATLQGDTKQ